MKKILELSQASAWVAKKPDSTFINCTVSLKAFGALIVALSLVACGGGGGASPATALPATSTPSTSNLVGKIYYNYSFDLRLLELANGKVTQLKGIGSFKRKFFDVSSDSKELMYVNEASSSDGDNYLQEEYFYSVDLPGLNPTAPRFKKFSDLTFSTRFARLSPDKKKIAVTADYCIEKNSTGNVCKTTDTRILIWDRAGNVLRTFEADNAGNTVEEFAWLSDGNLLMTTNAGIVKTTSPELNTFELLFKPSLVSWGSIAVSPDSKRIAIKSGKHLYTMSMDGSNLVQLTSSEGDDRQYSPTWSPDGKYIAFLANVFNFTTGPIVSGGGTSLQMIIAPADNKTYAITTNFSETLGGGGLTGGTRINENNGIIVLKDGAGSRITAEVDFFWQ